jgi:hypothetical protein
MADAAETISAWRLRTPTMVQIERHLTSEEFRQLESRLPEIVRARYARCKPVLNSNRGFEKGEA